MTLADDDPITLADACELVFRNRIKVSTLRRESGTRHPRYLFAWGAGTSPRSATSGRCFSDAAPPGRTQALPRPEAPAMDRPRRIKNSSALAALNQTVAALKSSSPNTSRRKHQPERGPTPLIADILTVYAREHVPNTISTVNTAYNLASLRAMVERQAPKRRHAGQTAKPTGIGRSQSAARRDLEVLPRRASTTGIATTAHCRQCRP